MKKFLLLFLILLCAFCLFSCGEDEKTDTSTPVGNVRVLNVYNWGEYISDGSEGTFDVIAEFEAWYNEEHPSTPIEVRYSTYATCEDMYAKITSGAGSYDIIIPSDYMIDKMVAEGLLEELNFDLIPNFSNIDSKFVNPYYDTENKFTVAYSYGVVGIIHNDTMVDEEDVAEKSWGLMWNEKYRGKILQFNNPRDGFATAQYYLGLDVNSTDRATWEQALDKLIEQKEIVQGYVSDEIFNKMTTGSAAIGAYYAGDYITMSAGNDALQFYYPTEGTNYFVDAMCIPKGSKNVDLACEFINYMLSPEVAIANAEYIGYASPNTAVFTDEGYIEDMGEDAMDILYGQSDTINANYAYDPCYHRFSDEDQAFINGLWEDLKTESAIEPWIHVTAAVLVASALGFGIYREILTRKRSAHYRKKKQ